MNRKTCPLCIAYLLDHQNLKGWKKCPGCGYCEDAEGYNLLNPKPVRNPNCTGCEGNKCVCTNEEPRNDTKEK